ncbi:MAG: sulfotransferase family protein [Bacteroidota bacterium]
MLPLCLWSGPRNVSTALMYSFSQRPDTEVVDEPLYAHYLRVSGADHPGRAEVLAAQDSDGDAVIQQLMAGQNALPVRFMKHMAHHLIEMDETFLKDARNVFLIRHPAEVINSFHKVIPNPSLRDIGIRRQWELFQQLQEQGQQAIVLDGNELLKSPSRVLPQLCETLGIPFYPEMLQWEAGSIPEDGVWASYWYARVHRSTGFAPYTPKSREVRPAHEALLAEALPYYERLFTHALRAN